MRAGLAARGYEVHLVDPVPLHLEQARARAAEKTDIPIANIRQGDARRLECSSDQVDAVLLLGPLYHLPDRSDRIQALREAWRVLHADGLVLAAVISRFASALDGLVGHFFADPRYAPTVWQDLTDGQHRGHPDGSYFTTAYLHRPEELASEMLEAGFGQTSVLAIEGPGWLLQDLEAQWADPMLQAALLEVIRRTESEPSLMGASRHLLGLGRKL
jgi:ubiquinone/menaquinone biosynthesis C-methylase UbiE